MYTFDTYGNVQIFVRAYSNMNIMGKSYVKDDIIAVFNNADFDIVFGADKKLATQGAKNLLGFSSVMPQTVTIRPQLMSHSLYNFVATSSVDTGVVNIPIIENATSDNAGQILLNYFPMSSAFFKIVLDSTLVTGYTVDYDTGLIAGLEADKNYEVTYYTSHSILIGYMINKLETPYFYLEIMGQNNINGISRNIFIKIPKVAYELNSIMEFQDRIGVSSSLYFNVINAQIQIIYY